MRVVLTGGGSGGHLVPFEPIVAALRDDFTKKKGELPVWLDKTELEIIFMGVVDEEAEKFFEPLGIRMINVPAGKLRRYFSLRTFGDLFFRLPVGMFKALWQMWRLMPDVVVSKGGFGSVPPTLAAGVYRIPILLHESDSAVGLSNWLMALWSSVVTVSFLVTRKELKAFQHKTIVTGMPVRSGLAREAPETAKMAFKFPADEPVLLVWGGSQGAQQLNELLLESLPQLLPEMGIIHVTGKAHIKDVEAQAKTILRDSPRKDFYKPVGFLSYAMGRALVAATVVVSRAGATSLAELSRLRKPAIVIPLETAAQDHQRKNAEAYEGAGAVRVISPENLGRSLFTQNVLDVMRSADIRETLQSNIAHMDHPEAARDLAGLILKLASGFVPQQPKKEKA